jgi:hypothetical protein
MVDVRGSPTLRIIPFLIATCHCERSAATCHCERSAAIRFRVCVATAVLLLAIVSTATAKYSGGSGTAQDQYQIATAADLIALGETPTDYDKHFLLTAGIDLDPKLIGQRVFDKAVISPDMEAAKGSFQGTPFSGVFRGDGHAISYLSIQGKDYVRLFGELGSEAEVRNLRAVDVDIARSSVCGGLQGAGSGAVTQCGSDSAIKSLLGAWSQEVMV